MQQKLADLWRNRRALRPLQSSVVLSELGLAISAGLILLPFPKRLERDA